MSFLDPKQEADAIEQAVLQQISTMFPYKSRGGGARTLELKGLRVGQATDPNDIRGQKRAKLYGRTWATPVYAQLELKEGGQVLDKQEVRLATLPRITNLLSYIVKGKEVNVDSQWHLKPGAYARETDDGGLEVHFNPRGPEIRVSFDPKSRAYSMEYGKSQNIPLYSVLHALGVDHEDMAKEWGSDIADANRALSNPRVDLPKLHKGIYGELPADGSLATAVKGVVQKFAGTVLSPDVTKITLGEARPTLDGKTLLLSTRRLLSMSRGESTSDARDAIHFKELWGLEDFLPSRLQESKRSIERKIGNNLSRKDKIREIVDASLFNQPLLGVFSTSLANAPNQVNPIDIISSPRKTTSMGPMGGIESGHKIKLDMRLVDNSHVGFIDPIPTPEGEMTGITLSLPVGAAKVGRQVVTNAFNMRTGKMERINPNLAHDAVVAFPDQFSWQGGKPTATSPLVQASVKGNAFSEVAPEDVDYVLPSAQAMFTISTNMIPFLGNDHGNRTNYGSKQISQAVALENPEAPLVQVHTGYGDPSMTWERVMGLKFSSKAPGDGEVLEINPDSIVLRMADGKTKEVQHYHNYPLNDHKSHLTATPVVKVGDKVKAGQLLADTNFTRDGVLAYGVNATVGYLALPGSTFEDGIVISETMAKKLASSHMYQERFFEDRPVTLDKAKFRAHMPMAMTAEQAKKLDDSGVILPGMKVNQGDTLVAALRESEQGMEQVIMQGLSKRLARPFSNASLVWDNESPGVVEEVIRNGREIKVHVRTTEPARVADKLSARHGNKGVISRILPDAEMPKRKDGTALDIIINPMGIGARINPGQVYETMMGKVAEKRGGPVAVTNFASTPEKRFVDVKGHWRVIRNKDGSPIKRIWVEPHERSYFHAVMRELEKEGLSDKEPVFDAKTGEELRTAGEKGGVLVGKQYFIKLEHMASKKLSARGTGAGYEYDANMGPKGGKKEGAQRLGILGLYSILAHESPTELLREMQTIKSDRSQADFWLAFMANEPTPDLKAPFAYDKFVGYLNQLGVNVEREGSELRLLPRTDKEVLEASKGEVDPSKVVTAKDLKPEEGGLFDEEKTGGKGGSRWTHHTMGEPVLNPMFTRPVANLLDMSQSVVEDIALAVKGITVHDGTVAVVPADEATMTGGYALRALLERVDAKKMLAQAERELPEAKKSRVDALVKRIRFLRPLVEKNVKPSDAYIMHHLPILPPRLRPMSVLQTGDLNWDDINGMYKQIGIISTTLRDMPPELPDEYKNALRRDLFDGVKSLMGLGGTLNGPDGYNGILDIVAGSNPKNGYFARNLVSRKQDLSMRAVIVPGEDLALDEAGLPREAAMALFEPFVVRELVRLGYTPNEAREAVKARTAYAERALELVVASRPVLLKRDPALHKFSVMAFMPKLVPGKAIHIHPLATGGFNADFDGDAMSVYVPVTDGAVQEAYKMLPSRNLFNEASGATMYQPSLESQLGLYTASKWGEDLGKRFSDPNQLLMAAKQRLLPYDEVVELGRFKTTAGRVLLNSLLPKGMRDGPLLTSSAMELDKGGLQKLMSEVATKHPTEFADFIDSFKDIGYQHMYKTGYSVSMEDLRPLSKIRDVALAKADGNVIRAMKEGIKGRKLDEIRVQAYEQASKEIADLAKPHLEQTKNSFYRMTRAGTKPSWDQLRQMVIAPILLSDGHGRTIPVPVRNSFADGLSASEYWIAAHGARKGIIQKTGEVQKPGSLNKMISAAVVNMVVTGDDCGTKRGVLLPSSSIEIMDRYLAEPIRIGGVSLAANTLVTPALAGQLRAAGIDKVSVRSPLRCQMSDGLCGRCYGVHKNGKPPGLRENIGMMAGQSVGERSTQLVLKCSAGLVKVAGGLLPWSVAVEALGMETGTDGIDTAARPQDFDVYGKDGPTEAVSVERHAPFSPVCLVSTRTGAMVLVQGDHPMVAASTIRRGHSNRHVRLTGDRMYRCTSATSRDRELPDPPTRVVQAADLTREDALWVDYTPLLQPDTGYVPDYDPYIAGLYAGDGCLRYGNGTEKYEGVPVAIVFTQKDTNWAAISGRIKAYYGEQAGDAPSAVNVYSLEAARKLGRLVRSDYVASNGRRSQSKVLADDVSKIDRAWLRGFLDGLIDTDGHVFVKSGATVASVSTTSIELAAQIQAICVRLGAFAKVNVTDDCPSRVGKGDYKTAFGVQIRFPAGYSSNSLKLGNEILPFRHALGTAVRGYDTVTLVRELRQWEGQVYDVKTATSEYMSGVVQNHNSFHSGGVAGAKELPRLDRLEQILNMYKDLPKSATLSRHDATVREITKDTAGGWRVRTDSEELYVPFDRGEPTVKVGEQVKKGHPVSAGPINPRELLELSGLEAVQSYLTKSMEEVYKGEGLRRRNFEVVVKSLTNIAQVDTPGDHPEYLRTDLVNASKAAAWNRENPGKAPIIYKPVLKGLESVPLTGTEDWISRLNFQHLKETVQTAAARGWKSDIHGASPVPGLVIGAELGRPPSTKPNWAY